MKFFKIIRDIFFPPDFTCDLCGREIFGGGRLCEECRAKVVFNDAETCPVCGRQTQSDELCLECKTLAPLYDKAVSALVYVDGGRDLILKFKGGSAYLYEYFTDLVLPKCRQFSDADGVCFVPMTSAAEAKRGYNQSKLLAKRIAKELKLPLLARAIDKVKKTKPQKSLTRVERENNLKGCFKAYREDVDGKNLIVVDDVLTTGATADAVSAELKKRGAKKVYFVTVASVKSEGEAPDIPIDLI